LPTPIKTTIAIKTAIDLSDYSSIFRAPRALQLANLLLRRTTRISLAKRTYMQA